MALYDVWRVWRVWLYRLYALYSVTGEPRRGEQPVCVWYTAYTADSHTKVYRLWLYTIRIQAARLVPARLS